jgi:hypothetical protein
MAALNTQTGADTAKVDAFHKGQTNSVTYQAKIDGQAITVTMTRP